MAKIAFVQNLAFEYLGVMYISSVLKSYGHQVEVFISEKKDDSKVFRDISQFSPDLVGFPCFTGSHKWAIEFARKLKKNLNVKTIFGGPHPTFFPEIISEDGVDIICIGEGENALLEIANKFDKKQDYTDVHNCWFKVDGKIVKNEVAPLIENLDTLPFPDRDLYYKRYPYLNRFKKAFLTTRGCPFKCSFCFNHALQKIYSGKGKYVRRRSIDNVLEEIKYTKERYGLKIVYFQDDTFILDKEWVNEFSDRYKEEINLPFFCLIRADVVSEDIIRDMASAGCSRVFWGIESGDEKMRIELLKKGITDKQIYRTAMLLKEYKIRFRTYNMLGFPGETLQQAFETIKINSKIKTDYPWCSLFQPYPRTELGDYSYTMDYIEGTTDDFEHSFFKDTIIRSDVRKEMINLQKLFFYAVKFPFIRYILEKTKILKIPPNIVFELLFLMSYAYCYMKSEQIGLFELLDIAKRNVMNFFFNKRKSSTIKTIQN